MKNFELLAFKDLNIVISFLRDKFGCPPEDNSTSGECDNMLCDGCWRAWLLEEVEE